MVESAVNWLNARLAHEWFLLALFLVPAFVAIKLVTLRRRRQSLERFAGLHGLAAMASRAGWRGALSILILTLVVLGSAGPQWGRSTDAPIGFGRDIMVVLDVSRSMLAEAPPRSRLERAKSHLFDLAAELERYGGYRVGLIAFAGQARLLTPLTNDYDHFRYALQQAHPDFLGPGLRLPVGQDSNPVGTNLSTGIELALATLDPDSHAFSDVLLVTDGDDLAAQNSALGTQHSAPQVPIHVCTVGDPSEAVRVPHGNSYLQYQGEYVLTRRNDEAGEKIAAETGGVFLPEETGVVERWFHDHVRPLSRREWSEDRQALPVQRYGFFYGAALVLIILRMFVAGKPGGAEDHEPEVR